LRTYRQSPTEPSLHFDPGPLALDLYRLLSSYLSDQRMMKLGNDSSALSTLRDDYLYSETLRILISSAAGLHIAADQYGAAFDSLASMNCGVLWPQWPKRKQAPLPLREACNKIIHAKDMAGDVAKSYLHTHVLPHVYLYGEKTGGRWRAKLSIVDYAKFGGADCFRIMGR
jgi:hypothetical protein